eukprot:gnl/MRDRNA2_/MRDRNA2_72886_c0_seq2.p1 gnl/MRDRNA2_/MRDRNA2_72886_c0~~gnl/MRDRNA2_/MRDRNA2_72886_c0_seq2.p1  ORF type:complete len:350 (+),score=66.89 gnl/MRDRNA2_/MRDRNA2_72886_c0_seq2:82-1131(+)
MASVIFQLRAETQFGETLKIVGSDRYLGSWNVENAVALHTSPFLYPLWTVEVVGVSLPLEYKYIKIGVHGNIVWEDGAINRTLTAENHAVYGQFGDDHIVDDGDFNKIELAEAAKEAAAKAKFDLPHELSPSEVASMQHHLVGQGGAAKLDKAAGHYSALFDWVSSLTTRANGLPDDCGRKSNSALEKLPKVPHEIKVNSDTTPSSPSKENKRRRLENLLETYGVRERQVEPDGNCQFRALADQLYACEDHHAPVRAMVVTQLYKHRDKYAPFVPGDYNKYVEAMSTNGNWGDHVTLQACADSLGCGILLLTTYENDSVVEVLPKRKKTERVLWLAFWAEIHYNSIMVV